MKNVSEPRATGQPRTPRLIIGQRIGRLGNQIQLLANLLALQGAEGIAFCHPTLGEYGTYFRGTADDFLVRYPLVGRPVARSRDARLGSYMLVRALHKLRIVGGALHRGHLAVDHRKIVDLSDNNLLQRIRQKGAFWLFGGWIYRYPRLDEGFFPRAREFFALAEPYKSSVARIVASARENADLLVGVHIRQTDFKQHEGGRFFFTTGEYAELMKRTRSLFAGQSVKFLVVSDEPKAREEFPGVECSFGSGQPIEDMYALGGCDYLVGSHASSFSLWPAFLNRIPIYRLLDTKKPVELEDFKLTTIDWNLSA